ncbi:hypothetical protein P3X46_034460 [Hevea brasiliensis]|uniref:Uncharacterized protein n=1 Tax=Hevea brasiliensis TaxID=3981 RepID=A0ABQ9K8B3_HEVBR|nr:hypothetical protein P3X46_034460 [Hevea brasiliensis]
MPLDLSYSNTTRDCLYKLVAKLPSLEEIRECIVLALNEEYTIEDSVVKEKDKPAIIYQLVVANYSCKFLEAWKRQMVQAKMWISVHIPLL